MSISRQAHSIEYANARIRGHRTKLFKAQEFERLLKLESFNAFLVALGGTKYREDLENNLALHRDVTAIGFASADYLLREFHFVNSLLEDKQAQGIRALGGYWDYQDFKLILRGIHSGTSRDELVRALLGPGIMVSHETLEVLAHQTSVEDFVSFARLKGVPFIRDVSDITQSHVLPESFAELEASLDKAFFANTLKKLKSGSENKLMYEYFLSQVNKRNLMMLARLIRADIHLDDLADAELHFLAGGTLVKDVQEFVRLSQLESLDDLQKALSRTPEGKILKAELAEFYLSNSLSSLDRALDAEMLNAVIKVGKRDLLGNGLAAAYLLNLHDEIRNLRLIAHGKSFGIDESDIEKEFLLH